MQKNFQSNNKRWQIKGSNGSAPDGIGRPACLGLLVALPWGMDCLAATNDLFLEATLPDRLGQADLPFVKRSRVVQVNWQALGAEKLPVGAGSEIRSVRLNLFSDTAEQRGSGRLRSPETGKSSGRGG